VKVKTGDDGKLFGSVTNGTIADELKHQFDITLDKRKIHLEHPIKALGEYEIDLRLHQEVPAKLKVKVESTTPPPAQPAAEAPEGKPGEKGAGPRTEKRGRRPEARAAEGKAEAKPEGEAKGKGEHRARPARPPRAEKPK
jgi:large subunit ribosomal protein L9